MRRFTGERYPTKKIILLCALVIATIIYTLSLHIFVENSYYNINEFFGPLTKSLIVLITYFTTIVFVVVYVFMAKNLSLLETIFIMSIIIVIKFLLPISFDTYYVTNHHDAFYHVPKGAYVTLVGHSNSQIEPYFSTQPGVFWFTAIWVEILFGEQFRVYAYPFIFLMKWFSIIIVTVNIPLMMFLFKRVFKNNRRCTALALIFAYLFFYHRFFYAAQVFAFIVYWFTLAVIIKLFAERKISDFIIIVLVSFSMIFIHVGQTLTLLVTMVGALLSPTIMNLLIKVRPSSRYAFEHYSMTKTSLKPILLLSTIITMAFIIRLLHLSGFSFKSLINLVIGALKEYLYEPLSPIGSGIQRPYSLWSQIVMLKAVFFTSFIITAILLLTMLTCLHSSNQSININTILLSMLLITSVIMGGIYLGIWSSGGPERVYDSVVPLAVVSFIRFASYKEFAVHRGKNIKCSIVFVFILVLFSILGSLAYFSGWNFQSISYSDEFYIRAFFYNLYLNYEHSIDQAYVMHKNIRSINIILRGKAFDEALSGMSPLTNNQCIMLPRSGLYRWIMYTVGDVYNAEKILSTLMRNNYVLLNSGMNSLICC